MIAGTIWIDAEETFAGFSGSATIRVNVAFTTPGAKANPLKISKSLDRGLSRPAGDIVKPWVDHLVAFLDPTFVRDGSGMGVRRGRANVLNRNAGRLTHTRANLVGTLI